LEEVVSFTTRHSVYVSLAKSCEVTGNNLRTSFKKFLDLKKEGELTAVEVGVWEGENSLYMLLACPNLVLHLVDAWDNIVTWTGGPLQPKMYMKSIQRNAEYNLTVLQNCSEHIWFTKKNSIESAKIYPNEYFDYVYIDGDHSHDAVKKDLVTWWPKLKKGGIFAGHDLSMDEVRTAVDWFVKENNLKYEKDEFVSGKSDWWIFK
jgi:hypothetical protein